MRMEDSTMVLKSKKKCKHKEQQVQPQFPFPSLKQRTSRRCMMKYKIELTTEQLKQMADGDYNEVEAVLTDIQKQAMKQGFNPKA